MLAEFLNLLQWGFTMVYQRKRSSWWLPCFWRAYINWRWRLLSGWKVRTNFPLQAMTSPSGSAHNGLHWKIGLQSLERCGQWRMKNRRKLLWFEICENRQIGKCWWPVQCWRDSPSCWKLTVANGAAGLTWLKHYSSILAQRPIFNIVVDTWAEIHSWSSLDIK